ncbi:MAG: Uma2 family endonuclease, partial [Planctomycetes bacterium]|nr:Uma2 family endonuclease [Planctomycetota bacterium]
QQADGDTSGYACFEIGLIVARNPDTVRCPAISFFTDHDRFAESDNPVTDRIPQLVIEIASTHRRSSGIRTRIEEFHQAGIEWVWVVDPIEQTVRVCVKGRSAQTYSAGQALPGGTVLPGLQIPVKDIFREPVWWSGPPLRRR